MARVPALAAAAARPRSPGAAAITASASAKASSVSRVLIVGKTSLSSPAAWASSAACGANQATSEISASSGFGEECGGARPTRKWVSKRTGTTSGVIQRDQATSSESGPSSTPVSSSSSRAAALRGCLAGLDRAARKDPDPRHEPRRLGALDHQHLDARSRWRPPRRSSRIVAAGRGVAGFEARSRRRTITCRGGDHRDRDQAALDLQLVRVHLRPRRGRPRRRHPARDRLLRNPRLVVLPGLRRPQGRLRALRVGPEGALRYAAHLGFGPRPPRSLAEHSFAAAFDRPAADRPAEESRSGSAAASPRG